MVTSIDSHETFQLLQCGDGNVDQCYVDHLDLCIPRMQVETTASTALY